MISRLIRRLASGFGRSRRHTTSRRRKGSAESQLAKGAARTAKKHL
ncbi:hypothetical protein [Palleronia sediminis]|nr:hypothetical protein [Palleronia sediminis]